MPTSRIPGSALKGRRGTAAELFRILLVLRIKQPCAARELGRRVAALTGAFAILVQAVLFGWHHHAIPFRQHVAFGVTILATPTSPAMPAADDHDCQICFALSHHGAVPVDLFAPSPPDQAWLHQLRLMSVDARLAPYFSFQSRAPPAA